MLIVNRYWIQVDW